MYALSGLIVVIVAGFPSAVGPDVAEPPLDGLYRRGQREYHRRNFDAALPLLLEYVERTKTTRYRRERLGWVLDQIVRIHLRERRDPDAAIALLNRLSEDRRFNDAEQDAIDGWLGAAGEWRRLGRLHEPVQDADQLYLAGERFFRKGLAATSYPADDAGHAHLHIAAGYLVPFIVHHDGDPRIGEALFMMGDIRRRCWTDGSYWADNPYLREVIRRFPHTPLAGRAYRVLEEEVRFFYTGSSGDHTPVSVRAQLRQFKRLAEPAASASSKPTSRR